MTFPMLRERATNYATRPVSCSFKIPGFSHVRYVATRASLQKNILRIGFE